MISIRNIHFIIRVAIAAVFLWFGIDILRHTATWIALWLPPSIAHLAERVGLAANQFLYIVAIFSILVAISHVSGLFIRFFSVLGACILLVQLLSSGFTSATVVATGLAIILLALTQWPDSVSRY